MLQMWMEHENDCAIKVISDNSALKTKKSMIEILDMYYLHSVGLRLWEDSTYAINASLKKMLEQKT